MTQQEIFQNMTKGLLTVENYVSIADGGQCPIDIKVSGTPYGLKIGELNFDINNSLGSKVCAANGQALKSAWNNTYGKGVNPEAVEGMKAALMLVRERLRGSWSKEEKEKVKDWNLADIDRALAAAELK